MDIAENIRACRLCAARFAASVTGHAPRPVVWFHMAPPGQGPRLLIAGQAPGVRVHASGRPFTDPSGDRLRDWMGLDAASFYDLSRVAIVPMAFCFPGQDAKGGDLPPPQLCAATWHGEVMASLPDLRLRLFLGGAAIRWHLGLRDVAAAVADWRVHAARGDFPLPHPSWRNSGWLKRNPWFGDEVLPALRAAVARALA